MIKNSIFVIIIFFMLFLQEAFSDIVFRLQDNDLSDLSESSLLEVFYSIKKEDKESLRFMFVDSSFSEWDRLYVAMYLYFTDDLYREEAEVFIFDESPYSVYLLCKIVLLVDQLDDEEKVKMNDLVLGHFSHSIGPGRMFEKYYESADLNAQFWYIVTALKSSEKQFSNQAVLSFFKSLKLFSKTHLEDGFVEETWVLLSALKGQIKRDEELLGSVKSEFLQAFEKTEIKLDKLEDWEKFENEIRFSEDIIPYFMIFFPDGDIEQRTTWERFMEYLGIEDMFPTDFDR